MASLIYAKFKEDRLKGGTIADLSAVGTAVKVALVTPSYTPNATTHEHFDDVTNEVSSANYTAGGQALAGKSVDLSGSTAKFDADNLTWSNVTFTTRAAVVYVDTGTPSTSPLIAYVDFGENFVASGSTFTINWDSDGIITLA